MKIEKQLMSAHYFTSYLVLDFSTFFIFLNDYMFINFSHRVINRDGRIGPGAISPLITATGQLPSNYNSFPKTAVSQR